jgi:hypothetical protein
MNAPATSTAPQSNGGTALRMLKFALAVVLVPVCIGMTLGAREFFAGGWGRLGGANAKHLLNWFLYGAGAFAILALLMWRPVVVYVFGHELMHALATWMCLGKVSKFGVSANGGQVASTKSNTLIRLAPYCVPLYALLVGTAFLLVSHWWRPLGAYVHWVVFALGFFYAFHVGFTLWSLRRDQPDLKPDGWIFSLVVIYLANLAIFALIMGFVLGGNAHAAWPALRETSVLGWHHGVEIYRNLASAGRRVMSLR